MHQPPPHLQAPAQAGTKARLTGLRSPAAPTQQVFLATMVGALAAGEAAGRREALEFASSMRARFGVQPTAASFHPIVAATAAAAVADSASFAPAAAAPAAAARVAVAEVVAAAVATVLDRMQAAGAAATPRTLATVLVALVRADQVRATSARTIHCRFDNVQ